MAFAAFEPKVVSGAIHFAPPAAGLSIVTPVTGDLSTVMLAQPLVTEPMRWTARTGLVDKPVEIVDTRK